MKNVCFVTVTAVAALLCGCQHTQVDQVQPSEGMQDWYKDIKANYPGFRPPALVSPGVSGQTAPAVKQQTPAMTPVADNSIDAIPVDPESDTKAEVKAEEKTGKVEPEAKDAKDAKAEVKAEEKTGKVEPEAKTEAKADNKIEPPDPTSSEIYVVQSGDTLGAISKKFYGSVRFVNLIQKANSDIVANANVLKPGMKLIIPKL